MRKICLDKGCKRLSDAQGYCGKHYHHKLKNGELTKNYKRFHGMSYSAEYNTWHNMMSRCYKSYYRDYHRYGGRGISVTPEWHDFKVFYKDMGDRPSKTHSLDRIDNDKNYSKDNCKWSTKKEQAYNRSTCRYLTHNGKTQTVTEWSDELGINRTTVFSRIRYGFPIEKVLSK